MTPATVGIEQRLDDDTDARAHVKSPTRWR
jgi:hypothetical protein